MPTLSELSSRLFRDVQANHRETVIALDALEEERRSALERIPGAAAVLETWRQATADAEAGREQALARIEQEFAAAEHEAGERRRTHLAQVQDRFAQADARAAAARTAAEDRAREELEAELARIAAGQVQAGQKVLARSEAHRRFSHKLDEARRGYFAALAAGKNAQQDELRAADAREMSDITAARDRARTLRERAQQLYERALKAAETRMRGALERVAGASDLQASFDSRRDRLKRESREREAALYDAYHRARRQL